MIVFVRYAWTDAVSEKKKLRFQMKMRARGHVDQLAVNTECGIDSSELQSVFIMTFYSTQQKSKWNIYHCFQC